MYKVRTSAAGGSTAFKQQIHDQLQGADPLKEGPVVLHLSFSVSPIRNWLTLWKPTIDALGRLLGPSTPQRNWHPRDGRIVELSLHCRQDPAMGNDVAIAIAATTVG